MTGRTIAIGDIHGCSAALATLLHDIRPGPDDTLVALGDYVNRGPDSPGVLDLLVDLEGRCRLIPLLGNHEEMLLSALRHSLQAGCVASADEVLPPRHLAFLQSCRPYHETDTHLFAHAGYDPDLPMDRQTGEALRWRFLDAGSARPHCSGKVAVVGHTLQESGDVLDLGFLVCIDTGCHAGGWLTAVEVNTRQLWQADKGGRLRKG
jgi:serine/threonine protein phosphatase 1